MAAIGIDTGGTFTDFIWLDAAGQLRLHKEPSTPADPSQAVLAGLAAADAPTADVVHGSTVATNALLQRRGARTALIATAGFADVLAIGRQNRPDLYALVPQKPPPLVPAAWRLEAQERVDAAGNVLTPLDETALAAALDRLADAGIESVAVCLLFAFLRPEHEQRIGALLAERFDPALHVSLSSDILPEYREFERTATTVINAYVAPLMGRYLTRLAERLVLRRLAVMQSNGGIISAALAGAQAARTVLSGPAGGVVGARFVAGAAGGAGYGDVITFDMGGTSTDVALCAGRAPTTTEGEIAGLPLRLPLIDIHTVGAGGGSLAYLDAGGALLVGPQSAGAEPGPAAYHADYAAWRAALDSHFAAGQATVTDANLVLGRLDARRFLGGQMALHEASAARAVGALAAALDVPVERAALAVVRVANATMERAIRRISVERGHDPRRFTLVAFGGGGPLHACELAAELRIPRVLVPLTPGVLSALGMLVAAPARDISRTLMTRLDGLTAGDIAAIFAPLVAQARQEMAGEGHDPAALALRGALDLRYAGQSHELTVAAPPDADGAAMAAAFHAAHAMRYGYARPEAAVELVTARLTATAAHTPPVLPSSPAGPPAAGAALVGRRAVWFAGGPAESGLYDRERLRAGHRLAGPAVVYQYDTTTLIPPGWGAWVDERLNLIVEPEAGL
ncbi:MAG: hydantoinase/oxoprolinase family protein [Anaerolineae bacterium]|nr:hydantoinase/oxoprolinase family protein [Anaerolineae bacterium]